MSSWCSSGHPGGKFCPFFVSVAMLGDATAELYAYCALKVLVLFLEAKFLELW